MKMVFYVVIVDCNIQYGKNYVADAQEVAQYIGTKVNEEMKKNEYFAQLEEFAKTKINLPENFVVMGSKIIDKFTRKIHPRIRNNIHSI